MTQKFAKFEMTKPEMKQSNTTTKKEFWIVKTRVKSFKFWDPKFVKSLDKHSNMIK